MKRLALLLILIGALSPAVSADPTPARWIRYPAISPDGRLIAFSYGGDLWTVSHEGGEARLLTTHVAHERMPVWSPDGKTIAYASDRHGNFDVFLIPAEGGRARRLTWHVSDDLPSDFSPDGREVVFTSRRQDAPQAMLGSTWQPELWAVAITGGRPRQMLTTPALAARIRPRDGLVAYEDLKGYENAWRKHHTSSVTRDIWLHDPESNAHLRLTLDKAEDRNPCWTGDSLCFLSERSGSFEVWKLDLGGEPERLTDMGPHPVRFLTAAGDGTLCFAYDGEIHLLPPAGEARRVTVTITPDDRENGVRRMVRNKGATEFALSPTGKEIAFILRGEVFVTSVDHDTTKRVTHTTEQERSPTWAPDGRSLYYASERKHSWDLYRASLAREEEQAFCRATAVEETCVLGDEGEAFQPVCSPDGTYLAFVRERDAIALLELATGTERVLVPPERNYSYVDGDISFTWSPDSKWLAFTMLEEGRWIDAIGVADVEAGTIHNVTRSGYGESEPHWSRDGRALLFLSSRHGRRAHANRAAESDSIAVYLTRGAFDRARLDEEEFELLEKANKQEQDDDEQDDAAEDAPPSVTIDFDRLEERARRLTLHAAAIGDHVLSEDGETVFTTARIGESWGLWATKIRERSTRRILELGKARPRDLALSKDGKQIFVLTGEGRFERTEAGGPGRKRRGRPDPDDEDSDSKKDDRVTFAAELQVDLRAERTVLFRHIRDQVEAKFYDPDLHGVDWAAVSDHYRAFLPHVNDNRGFVELLSEMLGELNASHTGARYRPRERVGTRTAALGLLYDTTWSEAGLRVAEVIAGGPADRAASRLDAGVVIEAIDGTRLAPDVNPWALLDHKAGKRVLLSLRRPTDGADETWEEVIRPISIGAESNLLYERWVRSREAYVEKLSAGRVGYVHVRGMGDSSFRRVYRDVLGKHGAKQALVVDTRFNGGGWLHDELVSFLGGRPYAWFVPRGKEKGRMGSEPLQRWARPVCVVQNEANYSDAHFFPFAFKTLGLGKLVGAPVAGTATAVWWERLMDPDLVFGIPQVGMVTEDGRYLENTELQPDVLVLASPGEQARGEDPQLEAAVRLLLE